MNATLLRHTLSAQFARLIIIAVALAGWGALMPVIYVNYGAQFRQLLDSGLIPRQFADFGGGDIFSLPGSIALGFIHPISVALNAVFAVGFAAQFEVFTTAGTGDLLQGITIENGVNRWTELSRIRN